MMSVFIEPDGVGCDGFLEECRVAIVESRDHGFHEVRNGAGRCGFRRKNIRTTSTGLSGWGLS
jgi:hypothetical protein